MALKEVGAEVTVLPPPSSDCPDAVFSANAGLIFNGKFIPSRFRFDERGPEEAYFVKEFQARGYSIHFADGNAQNKRENWSFEGAGDALFSADRKVLWLGHGFRTSENSSVAIEALLTGVEVKTLSLIMPQFYHLDTCFCPLDDGKLLWFPAAFTAGSQATIRSYYGDRGIEVSAEDASRFACNAVSVGNALVMPKVSDSLVTLLASKGLKVVQVDMSQFLRSGGATKCLTIEDINY